MSNSKAKRILEKWIADLKDKDRSRPAVSGNFDELFHTLFESDVNFETARELLDDAVKAHLPASGLARKIYKDIKRGKATDKTEKEFVDEWCKHIKDCGYQSFYSLYSEDEVAPEEKKYGNMSAREYRAQRKYATSFPKVDLVALRKRAKDIEEALKNEDEDDLMRLLESTDGKHS